MKRDTTRVRTRWTCAKCKQRGYMVVFRCESESDADAAIRHSKWTRSSCLRDCQFTATPEVAVVPLAEPGIEVTREAGEEPK